MYFSVSQGFHLNTALACKIRISLAIWMRQVISLSGLVAENAVFPLFSYQICRWGGTFADDRVLVAETADFFEIMNFLDFLTPPWISCENEILTISHLPWISPETGFSCKPCFYDCLLFHGVHQKLLSLERSGFAWECGCTRWFPYPGWLLKMQYFLCFPM